MHIKSVTIAILTLLFCACTDDVNFSTNKVLFEVHHINYAWGYTNTGTMIDSAGYVYTFDISKNDASWKTADKNDEISETDMKNNLKLCSKTKNQISADSLNHFSALIVKASQGSLTEPQTIMADAGTTIYAAYIFNNATGQYKKVLLYQWGDIQIKNTSPEATEIADWLMRLSH